MTAYVARVPSVRALIERGHHALKTVHPSTLSYAFRRPSTLALTRWLVDRLAALGRLRSGELVAVDSMPMTLPASRGRGCAPINSCTTGGGVLWTYRVDAPRRASPIQILKIITGPWKDSQIIRQVQLQTGGPIYLMDRGFWALDLVHDWIAQGVRFILRVSAQDLRFQMIRSCGRPRGLADGTFIEDDGIARMGGPRRQIHPTVRLVYARCRNGDDLILATNELDWSAERILNAYRRRWETERFHKFLKHTIGLAHYFSFQQKGLEFLLHVGVLLALLLFISQWAANGVKSIDRFYQLLADIRHRLGIMQPWRANTSRHTYGTRNRSRRKRRRTRKNH